MKTTKQVMEALKKKGSAQTRKIFSRHGAPVDDMYGVKVADLKTIAKQIKGQHELACDLYDTGNSDAMYLAGLVADGTQMTKKQLEDWAKAANWYMISEYAVPWVVSESKHARALAMKWIKSKKDSIASCGWCTYAALVSTTEDEDLDLGEILTLLKLIEDRIHDSGNRTRYTMNGFVISVGGYVKPLLKQAQATAKKIGKIEVEMGETACKVPDASGYIAKMKSAGKIGKKRKTARC